jgi:hypothetical protein
MTNQTASMPALTTVSRPSAAVCIACRHPLGKAEAVCPRCNSDNEAWLRWQTGHLSHVRVREFFALAASVLGMVALFLIGWVVFVLLGERVWTAAVGWVLLLVSMPPGLMALFYKFSEREQTRQWLHMPGMNMKKEYEVYTRRMVAIISLGIVSGLIGPLLLFVAPFVVRVAAALFSLGLQGELPAITPATYVLMFAAVAFFYVVRGWGETLGNAVAREYALAADAVAPPYLFDRQEQFFEVCKAEVLRQLASSIDPKAVKWLRLERTGDAGLSVRVSVPSGSRVVEQMTDYAYTRVPLEKTYEVKLDRWAHITAITEG